MKVLAIDTSSKNCSTSIIDIEDNKFKILSLKNNDDEKTHSQKLMPLIDEMFKEKNLSLNDIDLLACCKGPGSFTGIRIGVATIKAFSDAKNIPVVGVTSLESLAYNVIDEQYIISMIDAKNENIYSALFSADYNLKTENLADTINNILEKLKSYLIENKIKRICFVGDASIYYKNIIINKFSDFDIRFSENNIQSSISITKCAYKKYKDGDFGNSDSISPLYLKKSQAERNFKE